MADFIEEKYSEEHGRVIKWIPNPVDPEENFANKWPEEPQKERNFYSWIDSARKDLARVLGASSLREIKDAMEESFGADVASKTITRLGESKHHLTSRNENRLDPKVGIVSTGTVAIKNHNFYGYEG